MLHPQTTMDHPPPLPICRGSEKVGGSGKGRGGEWRHVGRGDDQLIIAESGIHNSNDVKTMNACGINTFLVGESLMTAKNPKDKFKEIFIS